MRKATLVWMVLLVLTSCARTSRTPSDSGIRGVILLGPMCPVVQQDSPCPDQPMADTKVEITQGGDVVGTATTGTDGRFEIAEPPGDYVARAILEGQGPPTAKPVAVTVLDGEWIDVEVPVDSGIR